jgi:hypothetical protein
VAACDRPGATARVYHVGGYTIWYWPKNLLETIRA